MVSIREILDLLPHRYPFVLVDRILEMEEKVRVVGIKNVTVNEPFFQGHFPGNPVMPAVLVVEGMAQVGAVMLLSSVPDRKNKLIYFTGIDEARFRRPIVPGDQIRYELKVLKLKSRTCRMKGEAYVEGQIAAEAEILCAMVDLPEAVST